MTKLQWFQSRYPGFHMRMHKDLPKQILENTDTFGEVS